MRVTLREARKVGSAVAAPAVVDVPPGEAVGYSTPPRDLAELRLRLDRLERDRRALLADVANYASEHLYDIAFGAAPRIARRCAVSLTSSGSPRALPRLHRSSRTLAPLLSAPSARQPMLGGSSPPPTGSSSGSTAAIHPAAVDRRRRDLAQRRRFVKGDGRRTGAPRRRDEADHHAAQAASGGTPSSRLVFSAPAASAMSTRKRFRPIRKAGWSPSPTW